MPNTQPPVTTVDRASSYRDEIINAADRDSFQPIIALYLTDSTTAQEIELAASTNFVRACKLYPAGATTASANGVTDLSVLYNERLEQYLSQPESSVPLTAEKLLAMQADPEAVRSCVSRVSRMHCFPALQQLERSDMLLLLHGEVNDSRVPLAMRETLFVRWCLTDLLLALPRLRIVLEHISTAESAQLLSQLPQLDAALMNPIRLAATITPQHLLFTLDDLLFNGPRLPSSSASSASSANHPHGLHPHLFCLPVLKSSQDRAALRYLLQNCGSGRWFAGTDSAPHSQHAKQTECCSAGCFTSHCALELYFLAFESVFGGVNDAMKQNLERFLCSNGSNFYGLPVSESRCVHFYRRNWSVPRCLRFDGSRGQSQGPLGQFCAEPDTAPASVLVPLLAGFELPVQAEYVGC